MLKKNNSFTLEELNKDSYLCTNTSYSFVGEGSTPSTAIKHFETQIADYKKKLKKFKIEDRTESAHLSLNTGRSKVRKSSNITDSENNINFSSKTNWKSEIILHIIKSSITFIFLLSFLFLLIFYASKSIKESTQDSISSLETEILNFRTMIQEEIRALVVDSDEDMKWGDKLELEIIRGAKSEGLDPAQKKIVIDSLNTIADRYRPYIEAIKRLFGDEKDYLNE